MGSLCAKKSQILNENDTRIEEDGRLLKKLTSKYRSTQLAESKQA